MKLWHYLNRLGSPKWFYQLSSPVLPWLKLISFSLLITGVVWGLLFAPPDYLQGNSYRIIYIHVPAAVLAQSIYLCIAIFAASFLIWRVKICGMAVKVAAPLGASFTFTALVTGMFWGKPTWGTWWVWDARLTSMLILLFLYLGLIALHNAIPKTQMANQITSVLAVVGVVNIPIIKFSVDWWNTLHQSSSLKLAEKSAMATQMLIPLLICIAGFYLFALLIFLLRLRNEILYQEKNTRWVQDELQVS